MALSTGSRLGPYELLAPLGAGGMGEVYRARDTRLGREVALKILPAEVEGDPQRLARFEQEARAASALDHPNIVVVHDVGRSGGVSFIAMELVRGRSLREVMAGGPLPPRRILPLATQIAEGLAGAHAAGIAHRDLKPENVMVSEDGFVKILDFGLAKLVPPSEALTSAPTAAMEAPRTQSGVILGTVGYMSPEQAAGKPVDYRSDQFSLGSILYEMATGDRPFRGESPVQTLTAIIQDEPPPLSVSHPDVPSPLVWVIERCLSKTPAERYESTRDLARELANLRDRISGAIAARAASGPRRSTFSKGTMGWLAAGLLLVALAATLLARRGAGTLDRAAPIRFSLDSPEGTTFSSGEIQTKCAISPDGETLAVVARLRGRSQIFVRSLGGLSYRALEGSEGGDSPFWSPDGRFLGFFSQGKLKKIGVSGGPPQTLCDASFEGTGSWSREGQILFAEAAPGRQGIHCVSAEGGEERRITAPDAGRGELFHFWPHFLPDGRHFLYVALFPGFARAHEIRIGLLDSKESESLGATDSRAEYASPGFLFFVRDGALLARPFDAARRRWKGEGRALVEKLHSFWGPANAGFSVSSGGALVYERGSVPSRVVWLDRSGRELSQLAAVDQVNHVRVSPDGSRAAIDIIDPRTGTADLWVFDVARNVSTRLTSDPPDETAAVWSPDGRRLLFRTDLKGPPDVYEIPSDGGGSKALLELPGVETAEDVSPDGRLLLFTEANRSTDKDIWLLPLEGPQKPIPFRRTRFAEDEPRFSPDGNWIAYDSDESGGSEIYVAAKASGGAIRVSQDGGSLPRWRRDGRELFFLAPGRRVMAAPVKLASPPEFGVPVELFRIASVVLDFDAAPDGQRFLLSEMAKPPGPPITVVVNWPTLLAESPKREP